MTVEKNIAKRSQFHSVLLRFRKNKLAMIGLFIFIIIVFVALFAPLFASYEVDAIGQKIQERLQTPNTKHILGTDMFGRDLFARIIYGARYSVGISLAVMISGLIGGTICGALAGYFRGAIDSVIMRIMDIFLAMPDILLAIAIVAAMGQGIANLFFALLVSRIPQFARIVRSVVLPIQSMEYVEAAKSAGASNTNIIMRHILPNAFGPIIVQATLDISKVMLSIAGLSFIGLGVPPPIPEWGLMLAEVQLVLRQYPYIAIFPGIAICITAMSLNLVGDGLRDALDPKMKN